MRSPCRRYCYKEVDVFEACSLYAFLRCFAIRSCASTHPSRDGRFSLDAGLDPMRFTVIFPDTKGKDVNAEDRIRQMKEELRGEWMLVFRLHKRNCRATDAKSGAREYVLNYLFETMVSISGLKPVITTWQALLEKGREAEDCLHREAFCCAMPSALASGRTSAEAVLWSRTDRIMRTAPLSVRKAWDGKEAEYGKTVEKLRDLGLEALISEVPTWALAEGLSPLGTNVYDLLRVALNRNWKKDSREAKDVLERARGAIYFGFHDRVDRWHSQTSFGSCGIPAVAQSEAPAPVFLNKKDLSAETLFW